jgi:membrane protein YdbS with pleckstrin-like domain
MGPQLRVVGEEPEPLASLRADARLRLWGAGLCACCALAMTAIGYRRALSPVFAGPVAAAFLFWALYLLATFAARRAVRYTVTSQRLEIERGILGKQYESIDLFRVRDVGLEQSLLERLRGVGRITVVSNDPVEPVLVVGPVGSARRLYDQLRDAVAHARKEARVLPLG